VDLPELVGQDATLRIRMDSTKSLNVTRLVTSRFVMFCTADDCLDVAFDMYISFG
jgi:hypothetical protein